MSEFKGTKGEWAISPSSDGFIADISDNFAIAKVFDNSFIQKGECEANLKLIACAPEMLEMLIKLNNFCTMKIEDRNELEELIKKATE